MVQSNQRTCFYATFDLQVPTTEGPITAMAAMGKMSSPDAGLVSTLYFATFTGEDAHLYSVVLPDDFSRLPARPPLGTPTVLPGQSVSSAYR